LATQPANLTVASGDTASFSVTTAGGTAPLSYQWLREGTAIAGATGSSYTTAATEDADTGARFTVTVSNATGSVTSNPATLTVTPRPVAPMVAQQPLPATVDEGQTATFSVQASSNNSTPTYQWKRNGADISGATTASYTTAAAASGDDGTQFTVAVSNNAGTTQSTVALLSVRTAPRIGTQPQGAALFVGQTATFTVAATGTGPMGYQWLRNGMAIAGAVAASHTTGTLVLGDHGASYTVQVSNSVGTVLSALASLSVSVPPVAPSITGEPQDSTVLSGRTAAFTVVAAGTAPLGYQWRLNGNPINGANAASYTTPALAWTASLGAYSVMVSNAMGSATSRNATLTVTPRVVQVSAGGGLATARKEDGTVWGWGSADLLGNGNNGVPYGTMVRAMNTNGTLFNGVASISNGVEHTLALKSDGTVWSWGGNFYGELGLGFASSTLTGLPYPQAVRDAAGNTFTNVVAVSGGWRYSMALKADGTVWSWGAKGSGQLGNPLPNVPDRSVTTPVSVLTVAGPALSGVTQIAVREGNGMALRNDSTVWIWGSGAFGRLGDGIRNSSAPVAQRLNDSNGAAISGVRQVANGFSHSLVLMNDGTAFAFGDNVYGELGDGSSNNERLWAVIVKDANGNPFGNIASIQAGEDCTAFLRTDGTVWMTGRNNRGQLARSTATVSVSTPMQVFFADGTPLTGVTQIAVFDTTVIVLRNNNTVWGWGGNQSGELGFAPTNSVQISSVPVKISVSGD
jgi:alpha-tubulin suppressor-like RCC1 family protein